MTEPVRNGATCLDASDWAGEQIPVDHFDAEAIDHATPLSPCAREVVGRLRKT